MGLMMTACSLPDLLTGLPFIPTEKPPDADIDEAITVVDQILTGLPATPQVSSPATTPGIAQVSPVTQPPPGGRVISPTVAPPLATSEDLVGSSGSDAASVTVTSANGELPAALPSTTLMVENTPAPTLVPTQTVSAVPTLITDTDQADSATATPEPILTNTFVPTADTSILSSIPMRTETKAPILTFKPTKTPTLALTPTASILQRTVYAINPTASRGEPDWSDPMDDGNNWPGGADRYTDIYFEDSSMMLVGIDEAIGWRVAKTEIYNNFYVELVVSSGECAAGDAYGMIFRIPDLETPNQGYLFAVNCDGAYSLRRWNGKTDPGFWATLINWKYTDALHDGVNQTNRIGVKAIGRSLSLYINDKWVNNIYDATYGEGYIGVFVNRNKTERFTIIVDELSVWRDP
jgi:hypothetical protein